MRHLLPMLAASASASAQSSNANYLQYAEAGMQALQQWYQPSTGLWATEGWWNSANAMTTVAGLAAIDPSFVANATNVFSTTYRQAGGQIREMVKRPTADGGFETIYGPLEHVQSLSRSNSPNWQAFISPYYDDNGWWALAWIAAYDVTKNKNYLAMAQAIFDNNLVNAGPTPCGNGGVFWSTADTYVNAITNELYLSVAAHLATRSASGKAQGYLNRAKSQWQWFLKSGMINAKHTINDGLTNNCLNNHQTVWSYNQAVILGGLVELHKTAPKIYTGYLANASSIAHAAIAALADHTTLVLHESCEKNSTCNGDQSQFKGIFLRNLQQLQLASPNNTFAAFITANADSIWAHDRSANNTFSINWAGPDTNSDTASSTSSALDALIAAAAI